MLPNREIVLERLRDELAFLDHGGYDPSATSSWRRPYIFEESPSCPNLGDRARPHECKDCWLMQFVAPELREEQVPCRFVRLTRDGVTVDSLYRYATPAETEEALRKWLREQIHEIQNDLAENSRLPFAAAI